MMTITQRPYATETDQTLMAALSRQFPSDNLRVIDLPYRLSSWAFDDPEAVSLWFDNAQLVAWAVLQTPFWTLDYACHSAAADIHPRILAWADGRARAALTTPSGRPAWYVNVFADQSDRRRDLAAAGFADQGDAGEEAWAKVFLRCDAPPAAPGNALPDGFTIRPLAGESEVAAYVALHRVAFGTENMTIPWRARTLQRPEYTADLDLVAVAPDGRLAAFCIGWLTPEAPRRGQIEPLGVAPDFQGQGLGRAILGECLRRLRAHGAAEIVVETDTYRNPALALYTAAGFRKVRDICVYGKAYQ